MHAPQAHSAVTQSEYWADIDGLRAVAVILVVTFHAFLAALPGGFIGVDIFLVISGFLITGIIARDLEQGRFSLTSFYARRARRIFPALALVLGTVLVPGWFWMLPDAYAQLSSDIVASAVFMSNFALLWQSGYFDIESARKPLLHLWSLGIEEQFYLFWPLMLLLAARLRLGLLAVAAVLGMASFALNVALIGTNPIAAFYLSLTRAWEFLAGGFLACGWVRISQAPAANNRRAVAGLVLIAGAVVAMDTTRAFPGWWAALPVAGAVLLLSAPASWVARASPPAALWSGSD
jgi:peptidoglycan/LPS O-acetylase OafA/YrhL